MEGKTYFAHLLISHDNRSIQAKCVLYAFSTVEVNDTYTTYLASDIKSLLNVYSDVKKNAKHCKICRRQIQIMFLYHTRNHTDSRLNNEINLLMDAVGSVRQTATLVDILSHIGIQTQCSSAQTLAKIYSLSGT